MKSIINVVSIILSVILIIKGISDKSAILFIIGIAEAFIFISNIHSIKVIELLNDTIKQLKRQLRKSEEKAQSEMVKVHQLEDRLKELEKSKNYTASNLSKNTSIANGDLKSEDRFKGVEKNKKYIMKGIPKNTATTYTDLRLLSLVKRNKDVEYFSHLIVNVVKQRFPKLWMREEPLGTITLMCVLANLGNYEKISNITSKFINDEISWGTFVENVWDITSEMHLSDHFYDDMIDYFTENANVIKECINDKNIKIELDESFDLFSFK